MKRFRYCLMIICVTLFLTACSPTQIKGPTWQEQYELGVRYLSEGNYKEAILAFTVAIEIDPNQALAFIGRGQAYYFSGETEDNLLAAQADFETAAQLDMSNPDAWLGLADIFIHRWDFEKALEVLTQGYSLTEDKNLRDKILELQGNNDALKQQWIFSDNMIQAEDLQIDGRPFWEVSIEDVAVLYPSEIDPDYAMYSNDEIKQYTQSLRVPEGLDYIGWSSVIAKQENGFSAIDSISFTANKDAIGRDIPFSLKGIKLWDSLETVLSEIGLNPEGRDYCLNLGAGKEMRFIYSNNLWSLDTEKCGIVSRDGDDAAIRVVGVVFPEVQRETHDGMKVLYLTLTFDEVDRLYQVMYHYIIW